MIVPIGEVHVIVEKKRTERRQRPVQVHVESGVEARSLLGEHEGAEQRTEVAAKKQEHRNLGIEIGSFPI